MNQYQSKQITVQAISVLNALELSKNDWSKLPGWFKKHFQQGNILIGANEILVSAKGFNHWARVEHVILNHCNNSLEVIKQSDFDEKFDLLGGEDNAN